MEVDRLRRNARLIHEAMRGALGRLREDLAPPDGDCSPALAGAVKSVDGLLATLRDLRDPPGYHPSFDQVVAIAVRPLMEQLFRWHQRLLGAETVQLRLQLDSEHVEWFPGRLRTILDNLISNGLKYWDPAKSEAWVQIALHV